MMMEGQVFAQAALLAGELDGRQRDLLQLLCRAAVSSLSARLRDGITAEDCTAEFIGAASLYALAALRGTAKSGDLSEFRAGDLTLKKAGASAENSARNLEKQAKALIAPYLKDSFSFQGV